MPGDTEHRVWSTDLQPSYTSEPMFDTPIARHETRLTPSFSKIDRPSSYIIFGNEFNNDSLVFQRSSGNGVFTFDSQTCKTIVQYVIKQGMFITLGAI